MSSLGPLKLGCLALAISQSIVAPTQAVVSSNVITVDTASDTSTTGCTLRSAITAANTNLTVNGCSTGSDALTDNIVFNPSLNNSTITINNVDGSLPSITSDMTINVYDPVGNLTINGNSVNRIFSLGTGANLIINNLTLTNGFNRGFGGAILAVNSSLTINNSTISDSSASGDGGGIFVSNNITTINNSTISGNSAGSSGGIHANRSTTTINNSTISSNSVISSSGGGIGTTESTTTINNSTISDNDGSGITTERNSTMYVNNSTISANSSRGIFTSGGSSTTINNGTISGNIGGIYASSSADITSVTLNNSILAGNNASIENEISQLFSTINSQNSVLGSSSVTTAQAFLRFTPDFNTNTVVTSDSGNPHALNQILAPLTDNGGPTQTHALVPNSPAINSGNNTSCLATDQRGETRLNNSSDACDIGSFEVIQTVDLVPQAGSLFIIPLPNGKSITFSL